MEDQLYRELILEHNKNPHNYGIVKHADIDVTDLNTICGDEIHITIKTKNSKIDTIHFEARGCAISKAATSILTDVILKMDIAKVKKIHPEDFLEKLGITLTPARTKCALLGFSIVQKSLK